jgi:redox-sensing transcriptional repressor
MIKYLRVLKKLKSFGFSRVYSNNLGDALGVSPSIVRKDLSLLQIGGNRRGGYDIQELIERFNDVLGKDREREVIIAGCGRIGAALLEYREFQREGIRIRAGFDIAPDTVEIDTSIPVLHINEMPGFVGKHEIKLGIISVPDNAAAIVFDKMQAAGIRGFLNFTSVELKGRPDSIIQNVNIGLEIENLFYLVHNRDEDLEGQMS